MERPGVSARRGRDHITPAGQSRCTSRPPWGSGGLQARTTNTVGEFAGSTNTQKLGSGAGVSSINHGMRIVANRGSTNTNTPVLKDVEVDYVPDPAEVRRFTFRVDIEKTAEMENEDPEAIITRLEAAETLATWPTFSYANMTQTNVDVKPIRWMDKLHNPGGSVETAPDTDARRVGIAEVVCEEVLG